MEQLDSSWLSAPAVKPRQAAPRGGGKWDQFEANERLFGTKSDFDENVYTTRLAVSGKALFGGRRAF